MKKKSKSVIQIKTKLRNLKDCYKQAKDNNKTGAWSRYNTFCHEFGKVLGTRNVVNLQYVTQVGAIDAIHDTPKHIHGCPVVHTPRM